MVAQTAQASRTQDKRSNSDQRVRVQPLRSRAGRIALNFRPAPADTFPSVKLILRTFLCWLSLACLVVADPLPLTEGQKEETYAILNVGDLAYTNVVVKTKTKTDLFISHTNGFANVKVRDLDRSTQLQLGYQVEAEPVTNNAASNFTPEKVVEQIENQIPPQALEKWERAVWEAREVIAQLPPWFPFAILGGFALVYLLFCNCCRQICRKAGKPAGFLIWMPFLKQIPLFQAARMSGWCILTNLLPPVWLVVFIVWAFKITRARDKRPVVGFLLLLPGFQIFAFLYLAWSSGQGDPTPEEREGRKVISLYHNNRRAA